MAFKYGASTWMDQFRQPVIRSQYHAIRHVRGRVSFFPQLGGERKETHRRGKGRIEL